MSIQYTSWRTFGLVSGAENTIALLDTALLAAGWVRHDSLSTTPATWDVVYFSDGEDGRARIYIRITREDASPQHKIGIAAYGFWDSVGSTGYNKAGDETNETLIDLSTNAAFGLYFGLWCSKDELLFSYVDSFTFIYSGYVWCGDLHRTLPDSMDGRTVSTANVSLGSDVAIPVAHDLTGRLRPGQTIHVINQDTDVSTGDATDSTIVKAVTATHVTVETLSNNYDDGALIGLYPQAVFAASQGSRTVTPTGYFLFDQALSRTTPVAQSSVPRPMVRPGYYELNTMGLDTYYLHPVYFKFAKTIVGTSNGLYLFSGISNVNGGDLVRVGASVAANTYALTEPTPATFTAPDNGFDVVFGPGVS